MEEEESRSTAPGFDDLSRRQFEVLCNNATVALFIIDSEHRCLYLNPAAEELTGFTLSEVRGKELHSFIHHTRPDGSPFPIEDCPIHRALPEHSRTRGEEILTHKDGHFYTVAYTASPVHDAASRIIGTVMEVRDISEQKRAEEALAESNRTLSLFAEHAPLAVALFDRDMRYVAVSRRWIDDFRLKGSVIGRSHYDLFPDIPEHWKEVHRRGLAGEILGADEEAFPRSDGSVQWVKWEVRPWHNARGEIAGILIASEEITARVEAQIALRKNEALLSAVLDSLPVGVIITDAQGNLVRHNAMHRELWGIAPEATNWEQYGEWVGYWPETNQRIKADEWALARALKKGEVVKGEVVECEQFGTGRRRLYLNNAAPVLDPAGNVIAGVAVELDVTSQLRAEQALKESDRRKDEFLATLAHELRNPLAPIRNGLQLLRRVKDTGVTQKVSEMMERQLAHMVRLIDDLLDISRISTGKVVLQRQDNPLHAVLESAVEACRPLIEEHGHTLSIEVPPQPLFVYADSTRLAQVVGNLLTNAAKYTPNSGTIRLTLTEESGFGVIRVSDAGLGIPPDMISKVFEMFTQINRSLDRSQGGLGIGLALVKRLVESHGGSVEAASAGLGKGSTFTVRIPLVTHHALQSPRSDEKTPDDLGQLRVLVVDDNKDNAESLAMLLELDGQITAVAHSGQEALITAERFHPQLAFLDIGLPGMDGYEIARRIRSSPTLRTMKLVALTGWGGESDKQRAKEAGFDHHLTKPVETVQIEKLIKEYSGAGSIGS